MPITLNVFLEIYRQSTDCAFKMRIMVVNGTLRQCDITLIAVTEDREKCSDSLAKLLEQATQLITIEIMVTRDIVKWLVSKYDY
ncbi:unnamed protein product, partial [Heterotrigona itama]